MPNENLLAPFSRQTRWGVSARFALASLIAGIHAAPLSGLQTADADIRERVDELVADYDGERPGGAVAVVLEGRIVYERGFGMADVERREAFDASTVFTAASMSKHFTALAIRALERAESLEVSAPASRYWPEAAGALGDATIAALLTHTGGIASPSQIMTISGLTWHDVMDQRQARQILQRTRGVLFAPGSRFAYSNGGYIALAEIVDRLSPQGFAAWLGESVFEPAGMHDTHVHTDYGHLQARSATGYRELGGVVLGSPDNSAIYGSGGIRTTIHDLAQWLSTFPSNRWLPKDAAGWRAREGVTSAGAPVRYADGMFLEEVRGFLLAGHGGRSGSFVSYIGYLPELDAGAVVVTNGFPADPQLNPRALVGEILDGLAAPHEAAPAARTSDGATSEPERRPAAIRRSEIPGTYWHRQQNYLRWIIDRDGELIYRRTNGTESALVPEGDGWRMAGVESDIRIRFEASATDSAVMRLTVGDGPPSEYVRVDASAPGPAALDRLTGTYLEPDLLIALRIRRDGARLAVDHPLRKTEYLVPTIPNTFNVAAPYWSECNDTGCWLGTHISFSPGDDGIMELRLRNDASDLVLRRVRP